MVNQSPREHTPAPDERPHERLDSGVVRLLDAAAAPAEPGPQPGEERALAAFRASHRTRRISMFSNPTRAKAAVAATIGAGTFLFAGVGAAAAGVLPAQAQDAVSTALAHVGLDVPGADDETGTDETTEVETDETTEDVETDDADTDGTDETDATGTEDAGTADAADPDANDHGKTVSGIAQNPSLTGAEKGAAVSQAASDGKSQAGEDHGKPEQPGAEADSHRPATGDDSADDSQAGTDDDSTGDADSAHDSDKKADGSSTAGEKSGGHSSAGSQRTRP